MEIIDESQSACLRATNTYLSEAPCNHNKTGLLLPRPPLPPPSPPCCSSERAQFLTTNLFRFNCYVLRAIAGKRASALTQPGNNYRDKLYADLWAYCEFQKNGDGRADVLFAQCGLKGRKEGRKESKKEERREARRIRELRKMSCRLKHRVVLQW